MADATPSSQETGPALRVAQSIDTLNKTIGEGIAWLALFLVLVQFSLVLARYAFGVASLWLQESLIYGHGILFMTAAAYTLFAGGHVRVDIFYREASPRRKAIVDLLGALVLLMPFMIAILWSAYPYVSQSWASLEGSRDGPSGIQGVYILKTFILIFAVLVALQGVSMAIKSILVLRGAVAGERIYPPHDYAAGGH